MITICLATYNGEKYVEQQLESLLSQTFEDFKILVRDDGSDDKTQELLKKYAKKYPDKIEVMQDTQGRLGSAQSFMRILEQVQTSYVMFCDQDDVWIKNKIEVTLKKMHELEKSYSFDVPLLVFTDMKVVDRELNILNESFWNYQKLDPNIAYDWKKLLAQNVIAGCTIMINLPAKKVSLPYKFDEMFHDHWLGVQVAKHGKIAYIDTPTLLYRQHDTNVDGAHCFGWSYVVYKLKTILSPLKKLYQSSVVFSEISFFELLMYKLKINIQRIFRL